MHSTDTSTSSTGQVYSTTALMTWCLTPPCMGYADPGSKPLYAPSPDRQGTYVDTSKPTVPVVAQRCGGAGLVVTPSSTGGCTRLPKAVSRRRAQPVLCYVPPDSYGLTTPVAQPTVGSTTMPQPLPWQSVTGPDPLPIATVAACLVPLASGSLTAQGKYPVAGCTRPHPKHGTGKHSGLDTVGSKAHRKRKRTRVLRRKGNQPRPVLWCGQADKWADSKYAAPVPYQYASQPGCKAPGKPLHTGMQGKCAATPLPGGTWAVNVVCVKGPTDARCGYPVGNGNAQPHPYNVGGPAPLTGGRDAGWRRSYVGYLLVDTVPCVTAPLGQLRVTLTTRPHKQGGGLRYSLSALMPSKAPDLTHRAAGPKWARVAGVDTSHTPDRPVWWLAPYLGGAAALAAVSVLVRDYGLASSKPQVKAG